MITIFKIVFILLTIRILWLLVANLFITFHDDTTQKVVNHILTDPHQYVRTEHACKFMYDMIWLVVFVKILIALFQGNVLITYQ